MRALSVRWFLGLSITVLGTLSAGVADAQEQPYNPDGTPSMINPDGTFVAQPGNVPAQPEAVPQPIAQQPENFAVDCDPDIQDCTDVGDQGYDDGYDPNAYQQFEATLSPYGRWVNDPNYGQVWVPSPEVVGSDFSPYETGGQWVASDDYGFTWVSDWDWGWAPFHYGRWCSLDGYGWGWIPGTIWGPAWVNWRYGGGYVGWAPMGPRGVVIPPPRPGVIHNAWRFALSTELFRRNPTLVPAHVAASVYARTSAVNHSRLVGFGAVNARINLGPPISTLSRDLGRPIPAMKLRSTAPSVLPRSNVVARPGTTLSQRPYMRSGAPTMVTHVPRPVGVMPRATVPSVPAPSPYRYGNTVPQPAYHPPAVAYPNGYHPTPPPYSRPSGYAPPAYHPAPQPYRPAQTYSPPAYHAPAPAYSPPAYHAPASTYRAPSYSPPASTYHAPAPTYHAPAPASSSRPSFSPAPSFGGGHRRH
jgi:hypothetical protein